MPLFHRPFPSRRWLKESLANAQADLAVERRLHKLDEADAQRLFRDNATLRANVAAQARTIADLDDKAEAKRMWAEDFAALRRELEQAEAALVVAHKRGDALDELSNRVKDRLDIELKSHRETRERVARKLVRHRHLIRTLWASRRRWQAQAEQEHLERFDLL